ncbi:hypothetical protein, partial [Klebsiella pneumoniae]|uniref:hypothetical protein n=1 Tax=Klebsiella pneumoniae TaxID=573 RepID=UPI00210C139E
VLFILSMTKKAASLATFMDNGGEADGRGSLFLHAFPDGYANAAGIYIIFLSVRGEIFRRC